MKDYRSLEQKIRDVHRAVLEAAFDRNTKIRMKMANVGRPTDNVEDETSKLAKQGEIKTKVIDEDSVAGVSTKDSAKEQPESGKKKDNGNNKALMEPGTIKGGKTEVDTEPTTDDRDDDGKKINKNEKATKAANAQAGVKEETMNKSKNFGLPADLIAAVTEALKGGQKKIDANHNGKIDGQDFKILRKEEVVDEERMSKGRRDALARKTSFTADPPRRLEKPEPKETKSDKIKAYRADRDKHMEEEVVDEAYGSSAGKTATGTKWSDNSVSVSVHHDGKKHTFTGKHDYVAKKLKDAHGIGMHQVNFKKASDMKEEVEQIDELDRNGMVQRYADKTRKQVERGEKPTDYRAAGRLMAGRKRWGGKNGIPAAKVPAVQREEVEQIDELSKGTVSSYKEKSDSEINKKAPVGPGSTFKNRMKREKGNFLANKKLSGKAKVNATEETDPGFSAEELARLEEIASNIDEVVTARKLTPADKAARAKYLEGHAAKMAGMAHHAIKGDAKSFKARNTEHGDYSKEPSKMAGIGLDYTLTKQDTKR